MQCQGNILREEKIASLSPFPLTMFVGRIIFHSPTTVWKPRKVYQIKLQENNTFCLSQSVLSTVPCIESMKSLRLCEEGLG